jgi:NAD(P)-dependent dehydrogenase (short-subunit alcohol dehydrogenase family)
MHEELAKEVAPKPDICATEPAAGRQAGRVAIITGAAQGLGRAFTAALAAEGASVVLADINESALAATSEALNTAGARVESLVVDVSRPEDIQRMVAKALDRFGGVDILVNNAGLFPIQSLEAMSLDEWRAVVAVNLDAVFLGIRAVIAPMKAAGYGRIINITSGTVFHGTPGMSHYVASKAGVIGLTRSAASELGAHGITVNAIAPSLTLTESIKSDPRMLAFAEKRIPTRAVARHAVPEDLVPALLFLAAPEADFMTGQTLSVSGGEIKL